MCAFGTRLRKATRLLAWNISLDSTSSHMCHGRKGICQFTGKLHIVLSGADPVSKRNWISLAGKYPEPMGRTMATALALAAHAQLEPSLLSIIS